MSHAAMTSDDVDRYADAVLAELSDLPEDERADLVEDLGQHLREVAAEGEGTLVAQLGEPAAYAAELRASAGLGGRGPAPRDWRRELRESWAEAGARARSLPGAAPVLDFLPELRPGWWFLRGPLLLGALTVVPLHAGVSLPLVVAAAAAAAGSVAVGRRRPRGLARAAVVVANVLAGWFGLWLLLTLLNTGVPSAEAVSYEYEEVPIASPFLTHPGGEPITNLYVYDSQGEPLEDVYVFDGGGRPVEVGPLDVSPIPEIETDYDRAPDGTPLTNRYPLDQYLRSPDGPGGFGSLPSRRPRPAPEVAIPGVGARPDERRDDGSAEAPEAGDREGGDVEGGDLEGQDERGEAGPPSSTEGRADTDATPDGPADR